MKNEKIPNRKPKFPKRFLILAALLAARPGFCGDFPAPSLPELWRNTVKTVSAPARFTARDWLFASVFAGGLTVVYLNDGALRDAAQHARTGGTNSLASAVKPLGDGKYILPALGAVYFFAAAAKNNELGRTLLLSAESFLIAGAIANAVKFGAHRARPGDSATPYEWRGPALDGDGLSFPSGHSAAAFSVAGVIARRYKNHAFTPAIAYTAAGLCAWSRVNDNAHWASDAVAGSAIGLFTAWQVAGAEEGKAAFIIASASGAALAVRF